MKLLMMRKLICLTVPLVLVSTAFGFQRDLPPGERFRLPQTQEEHAQQQALQGTVREVGSVPKDTDADKQAAKTPNDFSAGSTLKLSEERKRAAANLKAASAIEEQAKAPKKPTWLYAILYCRLCSWCPGWLASPACRRIDRP